jgi:hypothetical protein
MPSHPVASLLAQTGTFVTTSPKTKQVHLDEIVIHHRADAINRISARVREHIRAGEVGCITGVNPPAPLVMPHEVRALTNALPGEEVAFEPFNARAQAR